MIDRMNKLRRQIQNGNVSYIAKRVTTHTIRTTVDRYSIAEKLYYAYHSTGDNPILTAADVTDYRNCQYVADPFFVFEGSIWHLFFEAYGPQSKGEIGHATRGGNTEKWEYDRIVLRENKHLSFPYTFTHGGEYYMVPEIGGSADDRVVLYAASEFPTQWEQVSIITRSESAGDSVVFKWNDRWWCLTGTHNGSPGVRAYHSMELTAHDWTPHQDNPVATRGSGAERPSGRPIVDENRIIFFFQDCLTEYGKQVRAFEISNLTPTEYEDRELEESPYLAPTGKYRGWNANRTHHVDHKITDDKQICIVDGDTPGRLGERWSIGLFESD